MRKTITLGLSIILCLVGSLVLLSLIEVEQVVKAAKKTTTTYIAALISDVREVAITSITNTDPAVVTTAADHGLSTGAQVRITGVEEMDEVNDRDFTITVLGTTTFSLDEEDRSSNAMDGTGGDVSAALPPCPDPFYNIPQNSLNPPSDSDPCQLLADEIRVEIEDGAIGFNIRWRGGSFHGVKLSDGTFLERMDVYLTGIRKDRKATVYQAFFRAPPSAPRLNTARAVISHYQTHRTLFPGSRLSRASPHFQVPVFLWKYGTITL